jgi:hypothetical protein
MVLYNMQVYVTTNNGFYLLLGICHQVLALFQQLVSSLVSRLGPLGVSVYDHISISILANFQGAATYFQFVSVCYFIHLCNLAG